MGAGVSSWPLARAVAAAHQAGVVSGTALDTILVRRLQAGDPGEHAQRAMAQFPDPAFAEAVVNKYYVAGGKAPTAPFASLPLLTAKLSPERSKLIALANFVEVFLAKEGHSGKVGINYLEKIQLPLLPSLYGALLAGVDAIFMGAGIPRYVPATLERLARHEDAEYPLSVAGAGAGDRFSLRFSPQSSMPARPPEMPRPPFYAIVSSAALALTLRKKASPPADGFVVEAPTAGGHNGPPRGKLRLSERGEPIYGEKDEVDPKDFAALGVPFWLAGGRGSAEGLRAAQRAGAVGIQVGTAFALCDESGLDSALKRQAIDLALANRLDVFTDPLASPTGFPFKVARLEGTNSEPATYEARARRCDLGYLRETYKKADGSLGYRCASEPERQYIQRDGAEADTCGRKCLCNGLMANIGLAQVFDGVEELPLVTLGDDVKNIGQFLRPGARSFSALDVISVLSGSPKTPPAIA
jgi:nitronate monooxygenase